MLSVRPQYGCGLMRMGRSPIITCERHPVQGQDLPNAGSRWPLCPWCRFSKRSYHVERSPQCPIWLSPPKDQFPVDTPTQARQKRRTHWNLCGLPGLRNWICIWLGRDANSQIYKKRRFRPLDCQPFVITGNVIQIAPALVNSFQPWSQDAREP